MSIEKTRKINILIFQSILNNENTEKRKDGHHFNGLEVNDYLSSSILFIHNFKLYAWNAVVKTCKCFDSIGLLEIGPQRSNCFGIESANVVLVLLGSKSAWPVMWLLLLVRNPYLKMGTGQMTMEFQKLGKLHTI